MATVSACAQFIREVMDRRGLKHLEVGRRLGHTRNGTVSGVIRGERPVPLEHLEEWVKALELVADEARTFRRLAIRSYAPKYVQDLVDELDTLKEKVERFERDEPSE